MCLMSLENYAKDFKEKRKATLSELEVIMERNLRISSLMNSVHQRESARAMIRARKLPIHFWAEAMNTACYVHNRVTLRKGTSSTLYEIWKGRKPTVKYFHVVGSKCYILTDRE